MSDLMAWNADLTRMPYRMHSEYLRRLFLKNDLAEGRFEVDGRPISVERYPTPELRGQHDDRSRRPWRSVYKYHLVPNEFTFVLTSGGHNAGIVSEPGHPRRSYQIRTRRAEERYVDPETWQTETPVRQGSWWPEWDSGSPSIQRGRSNHLPWVLPRKDTPSDGDSPGFYVRQP